MSEDLLQRFRDELGRLVASAGLRDQRDWDLAVDRFPGNGCRVNRTTVDGWVNGPHLPRRRDDLYMAVWVASAVLVRRRSRQFTDKEKADLAAVWRARLEQARAARGSRSPADPPAGLPCDAVSGALNVQYKAEHATVLPPEALIPPASIDAPPSLVNLPHHMGVFVGRARELARLDEALARPAGVVVQAVHGLGGIGKSALVAHWAATHASDYSPVWWITADSAVAIDAGLVALALGLQPSLVSCHSRPCGSARSSGLTLIRDGCLSSTM
jgi:hypothetical protein